MDYPLYDDDGNLMPAVNLEPDDTVYGSDTYGDLTNTPTSILEGFDVNGMGDTGSWLDAIFEGAGKLWTGLGPTGQQAAVSAGLGLVSSAINTRQQDKQNDAIAARDAQNFENQLRLAKEIRQMDQEEWRRRRSLEGMDTSRALGASDFGVKFGG